MKVDSHLVSQVAKLAHLKLSDDEVTFYQDQLEKILGYVQQLDTLKAGPVASSVVIDDLVDYERPDEVRPGIGAEAAVSQAPEHSGTYFQVPRIIE